MTTVTRNKPAVLVVAAGVVLAVAMIVAAISEVGASPLSVDVFAKENSLTGGTPLDTGFDLVSGDRLVVDVDFDDLWSAGTGARISNADGLGNPFGDDFGTFTSGGFTFLFGALIGQIGPSGDFFLVGTSFDGIVSTSGSLRLLYWDINKNDNFGFVTASIAKGVDIDIKPGSDPNCFNNNGNGVIPVAILGSITFDVSQVDDTTVELAGMAVKAVGKKGKLLSHIEDVNGDFVDDLVVQIEDADGTFSVGSTTTILTGNLFDGTPFEGTDTICITQ